MKITSTVIGLIVLLGFFQACDSFESTNADPSRASDAPLNILLPAALTQAAYNQSAHPCRGVGIIIQYFTGTDSKISYGRYTIGADAFNNYWRTGLYAGVLKDARVIKQKAQAENAPYYEGIAEILEAMSFADAASMFGDIPYEEALMGAANFQPAYTPQLEVYAGIQQQLDRAIELLSGEPGTQQPTDDDLIFGGSAELWKKTAYALKARYLMQTVNRNAANAQEVLDIVQNDAFQSMSEQPDFQFETGQNGNNPLAKFGVERPGTITIEDIPGNDGSFATALIARSDPRMPKYTEEQSNSPGVYQYFNSNNPDLIWAQEDSAIPFISYVELKFLAAEAMHRTGGDATQTLKDAIDASLELTMVDAPDFAEERVGEDTNLKEIITEAYFAYYGIAHLQTWANYRRTGFPELDPNDTPDLSFTPSGVIPERFLYPVSEINLNSENVNTAIAAQGGQLLDVELAAFKD